MEVPFPKQAIGLCVSANTEAANFLDSGKDPAYRELGCAAEGPLCPRAEFQIELTKTENSETTTQFMMDCHP